MKIYLVDGTYELFRNHFGPPSRKAPDGREVGATLGLLRSLLKLLATPGITHVACAFDHVIESFRNGLYPGYKTGAGVDPNLLAQFELAEEAVAALGLVVWSMVEFEADDALASATARFKHEAEVEQIVICSPDKDLAQLVSGSRIVACDRRRSPTGWRWWAMRPTASPASRAGGKNPRRPCWHNTSTSRRSLPIRT